MNKRIFEKTAPERVNINSDRIINFLNRLEKDELDMHSVLILRSGKLICETYYAPFTRETLHRMFSITKSLVSVAVGILADEGKVNLTDPITRYFPEYEPKEGFHPYIAETTILDMLMMTTPHNGTTFDKYRSYDWVETFFVKTPTHRPGTIFSYDTSASHVMAALVEKISGMSLTDFVRSKGLSDLGFSYEAYCIPDGCGVSQGGSGLMARPLDIMVLANLVMNYGEVNDRCMVSSEYLKDATSYKVPNFAKGSFLAEMQGYGYQFWQTGCGGFMMYGMAGQLALCFPEKDLILVTTADTTDRKGGVQQIIDAFYDEVFDHLDEDNRFDETAYSRLEKLEKSRKIMPLKNYENYDINQTFYFEDNNPPGLKDVRIITSKSGGKIIINNKQGRQVVKFGFNSFLEGKFVNYNCPYIASGTWVGKDVLVVKAHLIGECIGKVIMQFSMKKQGSLAVFFRKTEEILFGEYSGFAQSK